MDRKEALYPGHKKQLENAKKRIPKAKGHDDNKQDLLDFLNKVEADGTSKSQCLSYIARIIPIMELIGNTRWKDVTKKQMEGIFAQYRNGKGYSQTSINKTIENLKAFYRWLFNLSSNDSAPDAVRWMKREKCPNKLRHEDLWTDEDMERIMKVARSLRDKCILSVLYEAGLRPGELRGLRIRDVSFNKDMVRLYVSGKTERIGGERLIPLIRSYNMLRVWVSQHPKRNEPDAWLWTFDEKPIRDATLRFMFNTLGRKAGIKKPLNPYILRHTALTQFYKTLSSTVASKLAGHVPGSGQAQTYCHLSPDDLEDSVREMNGVVLKEKVEEQSNCHKCGQTLCVGDKLCPACGLAQDSEIATKKMEETEEALNVMAGIKALGEKYPELGQLINSLLNNERH